MQLTHVARERRPGEVTELASEVRLVGVAMLGGQSRPGQPGSRLDGANDALEAHQSTKRLGPEADVITKGPLELPRAKPGELHEGIHAERSVRRSHGAHRRQHARVGQASRLREPRA